MIMSVNFDSRTVKFIDGLHLQNRSSYLEQLVFQDLAARGCSHTDLVVDCSACYGRVMLFLAKQELTGSSKEGLQGLKSHLASTWLTSEFYATAEKQLKILGLTGRSISAIEQKAIFQKAPFTMWSIYIGAFVLTVKGKAIFSPSDLRDELKNLLGELWDTPGAKSGSVLPSDGVEGSKYAGGFDCLRIVDPKKRPTYSWIGFDEDKHLTL